MRRAVLVVLLSAQTGAATASAASCWRAPVNAPVADPFREPLCRWCPGNRGIEYATRSGDAVTAVAAGHVTYSGTIAGRTYVVVQHADGRRATYGNLSDRLFSQGDVLAAGAVVGHAAGAFHFGLRDDERYIDPSPFIGRLVGVARLIPGDGAAPAPAPPPRLVLWFSATGRKLVDLQLGLRIGCRPAAVIDFNSRPAAVASAPGSVRNRTRSTAMAVISMRQMLEAGVHFGHQTRRWNPKMKRFIFGERNGIYIIDLEQTLSRVEVAYNFVRELTAKGGTVLFVGTKKQAQDPIQSYAEKVGMPYVNERWLGGMLTNFETISKRVGKMLEYERMKASGEFDAMIKKEALILDRELGKLQRNLGGLRDMKKLPDAVFVIDTKKEHIAVTEANKLGIPVVAVVDTNVDPDVIQFPIPGNDDAIRANGLLVRVIAEAVEEGRYIASRRPRPAAAVDETPARPSAPPTKRRHSRRRKPRPATPPPGHRPTARLA